MELSRQVTTQQGGGEMIRWEDGEPEHMAHLPIPECDCFVSTLPPPEVLLAPGLGLFVVYTKPLCLGTDHVTIPGPWVLPGPQSGSPSVKAKHLLPPPCFPVWPRKSQSGSHLLPGPWLPFMPESVQPGGNGE